jgi:predicted secreted protein
MSEALKAFQQRAEQVTRELGRKRYRIVVLDVNTGGATPPPWRPVARTMAMDVAAAPPAIEAGDQPVTVNVQGTIELQND